jgi:hypothetical protein
LFSCLKTFKIILCIIQGIIIPPKPLSNTISSIAVKSYSVDEAILSRSSIFSDLGILTDNRLLFRKHISAIVAKSCQRSIAIFRGPMSRNSSLTRKAFITYVGSILKYTHVCGTHLIDTQYTPSKTLI